MYDAAILVVIEAAILTAVIVLREPKLLIPAVIIGLPFEYANTQLLSSWGSTGIHGALRAFLNPGKLAMLATIVVGAVRMRQNPARLFPESRVIVPIVLLFAITVLGLAWSDSRRPDSAVLVMAMYIAFLFVAPSLIENRRDIERIITALLLVAAVLGAVALAQRFLHVFEWRSYLVSEGAYRANATFADPNILARYLVISITLAAILVLSTGPRRTTIYLALPTLALGAAGVVATGSRSGLGVLVICLFLGMLVSPIERATKIKLVAVAACGVVLVLVMLLLGGGATADRLKSLTNINGALGRRTYLIAGGWHMFLDNPLTGVGTGNFQNQLVTNYKDLIPYWGFDVSLSHTSVITIAAENGLLGLFALGFAIVRIAWTVARTYFATSDRFTRLFTGWLGVALLAIFLESQSEGRLLDEPYLYLLLAILVAVELGAAAVSRATAIEPSSQPAVKAGASRSNPAPVPALTRNSELGTQD
jgi:O-antigen ligase